MLLPVFFIAEYINRPESFVRLLIASGQMRPCEKSNPSEALTVTENEVRRWMGKNGYTLSEEPECSEPLEEPNNSLRFVTHEGAWDTPSPAWVDKLVPPPEQYFDRMDDVLFGALLARAYLRCGKEPEDCPSCCPGWLADRDCLEDEMECLYERARRCRENNLGA